MTKYVSPEQYQEYLNKILDCMKVTPELFKHDSIFINGEPIYSFSPSSQQTATNAPPVTQVNVKHKTLKELITAEAYGCSCSQCKKLRESGLKFQAKMLLQAIGRSRIMVPTNDGWIGVNLLECDGELPKRKEQRHG